MNVELDVEKRLQALVARDRVRIKEFFIDFDKLRKGWVGEAAVSSSYHIYSMVSLPTWVTDSHLFFTVPNLLGYPESELLEGRDRSAHTEILSRKWLNLLF